MAFLSLFSGSAIGFLISQVWWCWWQRHIGIIPLKEYKKSLKEFFKKFGHKEEKLELYLSKLRSKKPEDNEWKRQLHTAVDYVSHYKADEKILGIAERRWDMYHTLSATEIALCLGLIFGIVVRVCYHAIFVGNPLLIKIDMSLAWGQLIALIIITLLTIFLVLILEKQREWLLTMSGHLHKTRIISSTLKEEELVIIFPDLFPEEKTFQKSK